MSRSTIVAALVGLALCWARAGMLSAADADYGSASAEQPLQAEDPNQAGEPPGGGAPTEPKPGQPGGEPGEEPEDPNEPEDEPES
jgi:hypothetical protein